MLLVTTLSGLYLFIYNVAIHTLNLPKKPLVTGVDALGSLFIATIPVNLRDVRSIETC